ncbi:MAG: hypothetical protein KJ893_00300 [Candidatus Omnitrophica bacterium]|nr:hypothetical protein [Candidatus Omnitrophota bacterium]MBU4477966.1 hypothetical protein [Candidatus Omnitrophota bacterium]MCG2704334.1 hypothetical protein [Candidatus Omnitrophota bacterium]
MKFNDEETDIDINQWTIKDAGTDEHQINNNGPLIVPALGFLVLGRNADPIQNGGYIPDYEYKGFILANTADEILLENNSVEICRIDYSSGWPVGDGRSMAYIGR